MTWQSVLEFARGPFFYVALLFFVGGHDLSPCQRDRVGMGQGPGASQRKQSRRRDQILFEGHSDLALHPVGKKHVQAQPACLHRRRTYFIWACSCILILGTPHMLVWKSLSGVRLADARPAYCGLDGCSRDHRHVDPACKPLDPSGTEIDLRSRGIFCLADRFHAHGHRLHDDPSFVVPV